MSAFAERFGGGEVKPGLFRAMMKTDARTLTQETLVNLNFSNRSVGTHMPDDVGWQSGPPLPYPD
jgi:hypothetical protein